MQTQVLGLSVDSGPCLKAWADSLGGIRYPLLSDFYPHGQVAKAYDVLRPEGYAERALFVIDKEGIIRYVDVHDIDKQPDNDELFRALAGLEPQLAAEVWKDEFLAEPEPTGDVVVYCTPWCDDCRLARGYLRDHRIPYVEVDISRNRAAAKRVAGWNGGKEVTPTFDIKGTVITEFSPEKLDEAFAVKKTPPDN